MKNTLGIEKILQIAPANPGWRALYVFDAGNRQDPIAFWAIVETDAGQEVHGYISGEFMGSAEIFDGFTAYLAPGEE